MEIQLWRSILCPYELAVRELEVKFNHIMMNVKRMMFTARLSRWRAGLRA